MSPKFFDIHAHLQFEKFDADREEVIGRAREAGVGIINVGTDMKTSNEAVEMANGNENMWAVVGLHPTHEEEFDEKFYLELAKEEKVVAIGECGIDLFRTSSESLEKQKQIFIKHLEIAKAVGKPVMLHIRSSSSENFDAYNEALEILKNYPNIKANVHFFAGDVKIARQFLDLGHTLSFTGAITFPNSQSYIEVIEYMPLDSIMAETDCPFVAPQPYRGQRCEPVHVLEVYKKIAEIKNLPVEQVLEQIRRNVRRIFGI